MATEYKVHLIITSTETGTFRKLACGQKGQQEMTHDSDMVTCSKCAGKVNSGKIDPAKWPFRKSHLGVKGAVTLGNG